MTTDNTTKVEIPKKCLAAVLVNKGPGFSIEIEEVDVPEPGTQTMSLSRHLY